jgi:hypothetical protein
VPELSPLSETVLIALLVALFPTVVALAAAFLAMLTTLKVNECLRRCVEIENNQVAGLGRLIEIQTMLSRATELAIANQRMAILRADLDNLRKETAE